MVISERARHELFLRLEAVLGPEEASTLMEHLPPVGWADVATKRDLDQLAVATKRDLDQLAVATKHDLDQLAVATKHDLDQLEERTALRLEATEHRVLATMRAEMGTMRGEMGAMRGDFNRETSAIRTEITTQTRLMVFSVVTSMLGAVALSFAATHL